MTKDGRGVPGKYTLKNEPKLTLAHLLRRRKVHIKAFLDQMGMFTYASLSSWCHRVGIVPPTLEEFNAIPGMKHVNSPQDGVIVIEPEQTHADATAPQWDDAVQETYVEQQSTVEAVTEPTEGTQKKSRKKKMEPTDENS